MYCNDADTKLSTGWAARSMHKTPYPVLASLLQVYYTANCKDIDTVDSVDSVVHMFLRNKVQNQNTLI